MSEQNSNFEGWAIVEMMGHQREVGYVTTEHFGQACLFRVDVPELPERDYALTRPEWAKLPDGDEKNAPAGSIVRRAASPARSRLIGPPAIYAITPCTEETARRAIEEAIRRPLILLSMPKGEQRQLPQPETAAGEDAGDRVFSCCGGTPEDGHEARCPNEEDLSDDEDVL